MNVTFFPPYHPTYNIFSSDYNQPSVKNPSASANGVRGARDQSENEREQRKEILELQKVDREVRSHEQAHGAALGPYRLGGPSFKFEKGPDGKLYAVAGSVPVDLFPEGTPEKSIRSEV